ncbi:MAG: DUF721 domain-containing protein [Selenomonadaceae bacterium]|nr:DUF721 domain-containing protein [Selenomonadaceae bacterium]
MIEINRMLHEQIRSLGATTYEKFFCSELNDNWDKLVDANLAAKIKPVKLEHGVLFVDVESSALKDQLKFFAEEIIDALTATDRAYFPPQITGKIFSVSAGALI